MPMGIYAKIATLGGGSKGRIRLVVDKTGRLSCIKRIQISYDEADEQIDEEAGILEDLGLSETGSVKKLGYQVYFRTYYIQLDYLGLELTEFLEKFGASLTEEDRLDMSIDLCLALARLHNGVASKTNTPYGHRDLKPFNVVVDENGKLHLIDFGFAKKNPKNRHYKKDGTADFVPYLENVWDRYIHTHEQYDVFGLKRTLFFPDEGYHFRGYKKYSNPNSTPIPSAMREQHQPKPITPLTQETMEKYQLYPHIDTGSTKEERKYHNNDTISALALGAILIVAKLGISEIIKPNPWTQATLSIQEYSKDAIANILNYETIKQDIRYAWALVTLYEQGDSRDTIVNTLKDKNEVKFIAALAETGKWKDQQKYRDTPGCYEAISRTKSQEEACELIKPNHAYPWLLAAWLLSGYSLGAGIGLTLALTGLFTPFGLSLLGTIAVAAAFATVGLCLATFLFACTKPPELTQLFPAEEEEEIVDLPGNAI
jgi:Protein kinase domain